MENKLFYILIFLFANSLFAQKSDTLTVVEENGLIIKETVLEKEPYNPLAPAKAAFYSAVLPGLGQAYNKKYWKIPIIYVGIGTGIYFYSTNNREYNRFRDAYKRRLAGFTDDEFWGNGDTPIVSTDRLVDAQKTSQKDKDLSVVVAVVFYLLNIIDANVDAHLRQFNVSNDLSLKPNFEINPIDSKANYTLTLKYQIK
ncbi:MAG: DUF5683 domain-containing protein [Flavobacteriaceae bacterium]|nr:DUF5683 domain-containing protein [Flavobacteriaceae bacterium]